MVIGEATPPSGDGRRALARAAGELIFLASSRYASALRLIAAGWFS